MLLRTVTVLSVLLASDERTDQEIARLAGIDRTTLSKIRTGERAPTDEQVRALARVLRVHPNVLTAQIPREEFIGSIEELAEKKRSSGPADSEQGAPLPIVEKAPAVAPQPTALVSAVLARLAAGKPKARSSAKALILTRPELRAVADRLGLTTKEIEQMSDFELLTKLGGKPPSGGW